MKLSRMDSLTLANNGVEFQIPDPISGGETGIFFTLLGSDSKVYQGALAEINQRNRANKAGMMDDDDEKEILSRCVKGWRGLEDDDGKEIPFSQEKAKEILKGYPYLFKTVTTFVLTRTGFFPKP